MQFRSILPRLFDATTGVNQPPGWDARPRAPPGHRATACVGLKSSVSEASESLHMGTRTLGFEDCLSSAHSAPAFGSGRGCRPPITLRGVLHERQEHDMVRSTRIQISLMGPMTSMVGTSGTGIHPVGGAFVSDRELKRLPARRGDHPAVTDSAIEPPMSLWGRTRLASGGAACSLDPWGQVLPVRCPAYGLIGPIDVECYLLVL